MLLQQDKNSDLRLLSQQIAQCKKTLKELQTTANDSTSDTYSSQSLYEYFDQLFERWHLMRPELKATINYANSEIPAPKIRFHATIAQSILNLLNNAADANPNMVDVLIDWTESEITLEIKDQGEGFNKDDISDIGKPFFSNKTDGLGLGLFLSQSTVTRFGGSINLKSSEDGGTLTTINLPINLISRNEATK
jgi:two-component system sensor histidine kinase RegB